MNTMKRAHEIRIEAAKKFNCKTSEIIFSLCLKMAWAETKKESEMKKELKNISQAAHARAIKEIIIKDEAELDDYDLADFVFELSTMTNSEAEGKILEGELEKFDGYEEWYTSRSEKIAQIAHARHANGVR